MTASWVYFNETDERVEVVLRESRQRVEIRPREQGFIEDAASYHKLTARSLETGEVVDRGTIGEKCVEFLDLISKKIGVTREKLIERGLETAETRSMSVFNPNPSGEPPWPGTEISAGEVHEVPNEDQSIGHEVSATFRMTIKQGLHTRPAVLIRRVLSGLPFVYVEATHITNKRCARTYGSQARSLEGPDLPAVPKPPAFWLLLLRLEAWRGDEVRFSVLAETAEQAETALEAVADVLRAPQMDRAAYWRELGLSGWCEIYMRDQIGAEAEELKKRYTLYNKSYEDEGPTLPLSTPTAERRG